MTALDILAVIMKKVITQIKKETLRKKQDMIGLHGKEDPKYVVPHYEILEWAGMEITKDSMEQPIEFLEEVEKHEIELFERVFGQYFNNLFKE